MCLGVSSHDAIGALKMKPASPSPYKRFGRGGGNNLLSSPTSSSYREKEKEIYLNSQDSEFRERKLKLWGRVKGALGRWAQLRRMTKYGLAWLSEAAKSGQADREKFAVGYA